MVENLKVLLASSYYLYLKTQNFHWNITGGNFIQLHALFQEQYEELAEAIDEIAERIRALGEKSPGSFEEFSTATKVSSANSEINSDDMAKLLHADQVMLIDMIKSFLASTGNDEVTHDLLVSRLSVHEKNKWILSNYC